VTNDECELSKIKAESESEKVWKSVRFWISKKLSKYNTCVRIWTPSHP